MTTTFSPVNTAERRKLDVRAGDRVRIWQKIEERGKIRPQSFEGLVIARKHGTEPGATFTVRKVTSGVGVEKTFPLYSPLVDKIEVLNRARVRRSKLYYIREKTARQIRRKMKGLAEFVPVAYEETVPEDEVAEEEKSEGQEEQEQKEEPKAEEKIEKEEKKTEEADKDKKEGENDGGQEDATGEKDTAEKK